ncbi:ATP-binding protein [Blastococcus xanthinilyticus]|uniref:ATP-dependent DNA helicase RecG n=1 Tax=Blastococcus xanthinilyticus TaxID=1564164 RepID=A0A5S5CPH8_9ACTN|nr:ATP-binding protein [Blastococcus xanthinilyticus]TYP81149.1 ATP-dependent DNA helicase RecG [Blastococcus xanthinilyticus]
MTADELADIVAHLRAVGADGADVEAKASKTALPKSTRETLSAFANTDGGVIVLGLDESSNFAATGVDDAAKVAADLGAMASTNMEPPLRLLIETHEFEGVHLVTAEVPRMSLDKRPCFYTGAGMDRGSFIRVADGDRHLTTYEIQMMMASRGQPTEDLEPVPGATTEHLDSELVDGYVSRLRVNRPYAYKDGTTQDVLRLSRVLVPGDDGQLVPSLGGLVALGRYPQEFFPQLMLSFVHYPSLEAGEGVDVARFIDNVTLEGPIPVIVRDTLVALRRNMSRRSVVTGAGRADAWDYPETALREAIVNALVHRDFSAASRGTQVQIEMYPDRLEIQNPGGLFGPVTVHALGEKTFSSSRNSALLRILEDVPMPGGDRTVCENRGSGIKAMYAALRHAGMQLPRFQDSISAFKVTFPNHALLSDTVVQWIGDLGERDLSDTQIVGLAMLRGGESLDNATYRKATGIDSRVATKELQDLVTRELVVQSGASRWTTYRLHSRLRDWPASDATPKRRAPANRRSEILVALGPHTLSKAEVAAIAGLNPKLTGHWLTTLLREGRVERVGDSPQSNHTRYRRLSGGDDDPDQMVLSFGDS